MKKLLVLLAAGLTSSLASAEICGPKTIQVGNDQLELIRTTYKPEKTADDQVIKGSETVLVSGVYMFVRNGQTWNVYRCADDFKRDKAGKNAMLNLNSCVLKNDFEFGNLVKRYGNSGVTVRKTDTNRLEVRLNVAGNEELDYYDVKATGEGMEVIQNKYKENKQQRHLSRHEPVSLGVCKKSENKDPMAAAQRDHRATKKVNTGN